jgi:sterol desaturase/sphingolipid hydroxylase (fatty acid hydroxylase superfamily)
LFVHRSWSAILDGLCLVYVLFQLTFFLQVILTLGGSILVSRFLTWVSSHYHWTRLTLPSEGILEIAFSLSVYWLTVSFVGYWGHRFLHTPLLWPLHRFHHAATELNMITAYRQHPVESVATGFFSLVSPFIFLNVPDQVIFPFFVWGIVAGLLEHSQLPWEYGWVGRWVIGSPRYHQIHHSIDEEHQNLHFGSPLWDRLFGTYYKGTKEPSGFGTADHAYELRPVTQFAWDAWIFYSNVLGWLVSCCHRLAAGLSSCVDRWSLALRPAPTNDSLPEADDAAWAQFVAVGEPVKGK